MRLRIGTPCPGAGGCCPRFLGDLGRGWLGHRAGSCVPQDGRRGQAPPPCCELWGVWSWGAGAAVRERCGGWGPHRRHVASWWGFVTRPTCRLCGPPEPFACGPARCLLPADCSYSDPAGPPGSPGKPCCAGCCSGGLEPCSDKPVWSAGRAGSLPAPGGTLDWAGATSQLAPWTVATRLRRLSPAPT